MPGSIASVAPENKTHVKSHVEHLPPGPKRKVFAIALLPFFELIRWLPIVLLIEELPVGNVSTASQKLAKVTYALAVHSERLADVTSHGKCGMRAFATKERLRHLSAGRIVGFWDNFCDHGNRIFSWQTKKR